MLGEHLARLEYAVVDVETTGLCPNGNDRVLEFAVKRVDANGNELASFTTLVNPCRDIGASHIHGLTAREVQHAPKFKEIAGDVVQSLRGAVFVAHNAVFDWRFVQSEFRRAGLSIPKMPRLCTMRLFGQVFPTVPNRNLRACCQALDIEASRSHMASDDAEAACQIMQKCFARVQNWDAMLPSIGIHSAPPDDGFWPEIPPARNYMTRTAAEEAALDDEHYLERLVSLLPRTSKPGARAGQYVALLDQALSDRVLTKVEAHQLHDLAKDLGMSRRMVKHLHRSYVGSLIRVAVKDQTLSQKERADIQNVCELLGAEWGDCLVEHRGEVDSPPATVDAPPELRGRSVCFTGELKCELDGARVTRIQAETIAKKHGLVIAKSVTKKLDYLIVADPHSMSKKATTARQRGVEIVAEPVFWRWLGVPFR